MSKLSHLPGLGDLDAEGVGYRVVQPVSVETVRDLVKAKAFSRVEISDGCGGSPRFSAMYWLDGAPVVITGRIEERD
ncbi:hypothetical protein PUR71_14900 [Streptomyces sp. SP17BM10]|uniref:hypothetical protein n=1 Tax=Streptomyces sp. SP17BM10 TaxID=3002530 RepID=UPI002E75B045|nr:hypothetical protein [Streptomyces sp. SP17BM10]MEE1784176.1 hypothetical protein [Streptomyces sp. SP17BM10]